MMTFLVVRSDNYLPTRDSGRTSLSTCTAAFDSSAAP